MTEIEHKNHIANCDHCSQVKELIIKLKQTNLQSDRSQPDFILNKLNKLMGVKND